MEGRPVALLFSDIEGSTRLLQHLGPVYGDVLVEHRRLLRAQFAAHRGEEQGTAGDSFFVTFPTADEAVAAALGAQLELARHEWPDGGAVRVRMGLHLGAVQSVADTVVGMAVHEAARIASAAHGGQVLASDGIVGSASTLPSGAGWTPLGEHQLKDLAGPVSLHQLTHHELGGHFPPPRSSGGSRSNLPPQPTAFIGRLAELDHVRELLTGTHLLTVTGTGGVGKSRMALRVAADVVPLFVDGVWFVDLAAVNDPAAVVSAVAASVGVQATTLDELTTAIADQRTLVLIDNCEHLIDATSEVVGNLLRRAPEVTVLTTSREPLGVPGEVVWRVPPLSPADAAALLTARARAVNQDFAITDTNRAAVDALCQRLDSIPLALELAAARLTALSVEQLEARLDQRFRLLAGGVRGVLERHRTLQATVDWSYGLLSADEQTVLRRTGVFAAGFPLDALELVAPELDPIELLDLVDRLVRKSLVVVEQRDGEPRYRLLETVRQYMLDQMIRAGEMVEARDAHLWWVDSVVGAAAQTLWLGGDEQTWLARLDLEDANIRSAVDWALEQGETATASAIVFGCVGWFVSRGRANEGVRLSQQVLDAGPTGMAEALVASAEMSMASGCGRLVPEMVDRVRRTADRLVGTPYEWVRPIALAHVAAWSYPAGDVEGATRAIVECEALVEEACPHGAGAVGWALQTLFWTNLDAGRLDAARTAADEAMAVAAQARLSMLQSRMAVNRARMALADGDAAGAWNYAEQAIHVARTTGETFVVAAATQLMADVALARGDVTLARDLLASIIDAVAESMTQAAADEVVARVAALSA